MIRELSEEDFYNGKVDLCVDIVRKNFGESAAKKFRKEVTHCCSDEGVGPYHMEWPPTYYVYEEDGVVLGFAGMMESWIMHGLWDFIWINVHPDHQGRGIGKALTEHRIEEVKRLGGSAINLVTKQYVFFKQFGFRVIHLYEGHQMWVHMSKQLKEVGLD